MIQYINSLLTPFEHIIRKYKKYIWYFLLLLSFASFGFFFLDDGLKESWEKAFLILWIILWIPIFARVVWLRIFQVMMPLRKELGILMGTLALVHGMSFFLENYKYITPLDISFWWYDSIPTHMSFAFIAWILTLLLLITSNTWSMQILWKRWKLLHRSIYIIAICVLLHVVLLKLARHFEIWPVIVFVFYSLGKILEWRGISFEKWKI